MADKIERIIADTFLQMAEGLETGNFVILTALSTGQHTDGKL